MLFIEKTKRSKAAALAYYTFILRNGPFFFRIESFCLELNEKQKALMAFIIGIYIL